MTGAGGGALAVLLPIFNPLDADDVVDNDDDVDGTSANSAAALASKSASDKAPRTEAGAVATGLLEGIDDVTVEVASWLAFLRGSLLAVETSGAGLF